VAFSSTVDDTHNSKPSVLKKKNQKGTVNLVDSMSESLGDYNTSSCYDLKIPPSGSKTEEGGKKAQHRQVVKYHKPTTLEDPSITQLKYSCTRIPHITSVNEI